MDVEFSIKLVQPLSLSLFSPCPAIICARSRSQCSMYHFECELKSRKWAFERDNLIHFVPVCCVCMWVRTTQRVFLQQCVRAWALPIIFSPFIDCKSDTHSYYTQFFPSIPFCVAMVVAVFFCFCALLYKLFSFQFHSITTLKKTQ